MNRFGYFLSRHPTPIYMSAFVPKAREVACRIAHGFITTKPDGE